MIKYHQYRTLPSDYIQQKFHEFWEEDLPNQDKTTRAIFSPDSNSKAEIQAVTDQIFAGAEILPYSFGEQCQVDVKVPDGASVKAGTVLGIVTGATLLLLERERTMLNLLQRLCGIATMTRKFTSLPGSEKIWILDTRKTTPGLRYFEKYAVVVGGGRNHRLDLSSGILIKDNHLQAAGSIHAAVESIRAQDYQLPIELEVDNLEQVEIGLAVGVDGFLLDNMTPEKTRNAVDMIRKYPNGDDIFIEASGGINIETVSGYFDTGINAVSIGALTHSSRGTDIRLEFIDS